jgi:hypothetical protein
MKTKSPAVPLFSFLLLAALASPCRAQVGEPQIDPDKNHEIQRLMDLTSSKDMMVLMIENFLPPLKQAYPGVPSDVWRKFQTGMVDRIPEALEALIPVYDRHFTLEQLRELNAFYESPIGQHTVTVMPLLTQESMTIGQEWGVRVADEVAKELGIIGG